MEASECIPSSDSSSGQVNDSADSCFGFLLVQPRSHRRRSRHPHRSPLLSSPSNPRHRLPLPDRLLVGPRWSCHDDRDFPAASRRAESDEQGSGGVIRCCEYSFFFVLLAPSVPIVRCDEKRSVRKDEKLTFRLSLLKDRRPSPSCHRVDVLSSNDEDVCLGSQGRGEDFSRSRGGASSDQEEELGAFNGRVSFLTLSSPSTRRN